MDRAGEDEITSSKRASRLEQPRALIVDDDEPLRRGFGRCLELQGYEVTLAPDAASALSTLELESFDVIVSDIMMPAMSGLELLERMRAMHVDAPVVLVTGDPRLETAVQAIEHQVLRYLSKPVNPQDLSRVVGDVVRLHGIARAKRLALDNEGLRSLVDELTRSEAAAQAGTRAKQEFLSKMGHELRTPMTALIGMTDFVLASELTSCQRDALEIVATSASALMVTIADVLALSALDHSPVPPASKEFHVRDALDRALEPLVQQASAKALSLTYSVAPNVPDLLIGDSERLGHVLKHLVGNAIKFTRAGQVKACFRGTPLPGSGVALEVSISDTGIGMSAETLSHVVDAFSQGDDSPTREYGGAGLGLTIASRLLGLMGGALEIDSAPNSGTTVRFIARFESIPQETDFLVLDAFG